MDEVGVSICDVIYFSEEFFFVIYFTLKWFFNLRKDITHFLIEKYHNVDSLQDINLLCELIFLIYVTGVMNDLN